MRELSIKRFVTKLNETNMYLAIDRSSHSALLIDPSDREAIRQYTLAEDCHKEVRISYIILTHEHYDHIAALNEIREQLPSCRVIASKTCSDRIQSPQQNMSKYFNIIVELKDRYNAGRSRKCPIKPYMAEAADIIFEASMCIDWQGHCLTLQEAPGHSPGSILIDIDGKHLFCGDSLSYDYEVITKFPDGDNTDYELITKPILYSFARETAVYPGHGRSPFSLKDLPAF